MDSEADTGEGAVVGVVGLGRIGRLDVLVWEAWRMLGPAKGHELVKRTAGGGRVEDEHPQFGRVPEMERRSGRQLRFPFSLSLPYIPIKQTTPSPFRHAPAFPRHAVLSYHPFLDRQAQCPSWTPASLSSSPSFPVPRTALSICS